MSDRPAPPPAPPRLRRADRPVAAGRALQPLRQGFVCGHAAGLPACWCASEPLLPARAIVPGRHCLCPDCLRQRRAGQD